MGRFGAGNKFAAKRKAEALAKVARIRSRKIPKVETGNAASSVLVDKTNTTNGGTPRLAAAQEIASAPHTGRQSNISALSCGFE